MIKLTILLFSLGALAASVNASCDGLNCDPCPAFITPDGTTYQAKPVSDCINNNGQWRLNCRCDSPPEGSIPAGRSASTTATSAQTTAANDTTDTGDGTNGDDPFNDDIPPGGGPGGIPTQSNGASSLKAMLYPAMALAAITAVFIA